MGRLGPRGPPRFYLETPPQRPHRRRHRRHRTVSSDDDESYSSLESPSTDDGEDLLKIVDQVELDARVFAKSVRSERRAEKRRRADAEFEDVMNEARL